jgi:3-oxochol-4-en-24-oyl-CoA dehydrogenase
MSTLATERVAIGTGQDEAVEALLAAGGAVNPLYAERTGLHVAAALSVALLGERGAHPAIRKLIGTGHRQAVAETALDLLGPDGAAESEASQEFLLTRCLSIAGGTTQILLNQVAERVLGLPRRRSRSRSPTCTSPPARCTWPPCPRAGGWTWGWTRPRK